MGNKNDGLFCSCGQVIVMVRPQRSQDFEVPSKAGDRLMVAPHEHWKDCQPVPWRRKTIGSPGFAGSLALGTGLSRPQRGQGMEVHGEPGGTLIPTPHAQVMTTSPSMRPSRLPTSRERWTISSRASTGGRFEASRAWAGVSAESVRFPMQPALPVILRYAA